MKRRIGGILLAAVLLAMMLGGCASYDDLMLELYTMLGGEVGSASSSEETDVSEVSSAIDLPNGDSSTGEGDISFEDVSEDTPPALDIALNEAIPALLDMTNSELKEVIDPDTPADAQIVMGGTPYLSYYDETTDVHMTIEFVAGTEDLLAAWESAERRAGDGMPGYNCFPDDCRVAYVGLSGRGSFLDTLILGDGDKSYDSLCLLFGQQPEIQVDPADPPEMMDSEMYRDYAIQYYVFTYDGVNIRLNYTEEGGGFVLGGISLYTDDPYRYFT